MADMTSSQILQWTIGIILVTGGAMLGIVAKMVKSKQSRIECSLLHKTLTDSLSDIKERLEKGDTKMDGMNGTLIKISTILEERSKIETDRYEKHSDKWKNE